ncbi:Gfo/Idh/MocA family protein [Pseudolysinimonas yzui]|nr:Gfo/Idh/MocA family oxidoreductase [Pseudolysinimonas yzui]
MIGAGAISAQYLKTLDSLSGLRLVAVADLDRARAEQAADDRQGVRAVTVPELLADDAVDVVLNLTLPAAHANVALAAIEAGKAVYGEKPLATTTVDGQRILDAAGMAGVRIGCAPDTVLGTGLQTARQALDAGHVGRPISATATMVTPGHELWHPNPDFYYRRGGGPLFDMGPYYVTALVSLLGTVTSVLGVGTRMRGDRHIFSGPRRGEVIPVDVDTHVSGILHHRGGAVTTMVMSFDAVRTRAPHIEVHGELGSMVVPDPNRFDGPVEIFTLGDDDWTTHEPSAGYIDGQRGIGLLDFAETPTGVEPRTGGRLALHVLEVMEGLLASATAGRVVQIATSVERPAPVPLTRLDSRPGLRAV